MSRGVLEPRVLRSKFPLTRLSAPPTWPLRLAGQCMIICLSYMDYEYDLPFLAEPQPLATCIRKI